MVSTVWKTFLKFKDMWLLSGGGDMLNGQVEVGNVDRPVSNLTDLSQVIHMGGLGIELTLLWFQLSEYICYSCRETIIRKDLKFFHTDV